MLAYKYRHRVAIQERVEVQDALTGAMTHTWRNVWLSPDVELASVPARVLTGAGREFFAADAKQSEVTARIELRWFPGLTSAMRVLWQGRPYNILEISTDETDRREYRLRCSGGLTDGA